MNPVNPINPTTLPPNAGTPTTLPTIQSVSDVTVIQGVNTAGTVRINHLAELEAAINFLANAAEITAIVFGIFLLYRTVVMKDKTKAKVTRGLLLASALILGGLMVPGTLNWLFAGSGCGSARIFN